MLLLAFIIPVAVWSISIAVCGIFPAGDKTIFTVDMLAQYTGFFEFFQRVLSNGNEFFYSFFHRLGSETLGTIAYYLMSPVNFLILLFKPENISEAVLVINAIKIGLCGLSFCLFLNIKFKNKAWINIGFSTCYALMAYNMAYQLNIMWLDAVILLPIVIIGIEKIFFEDKYWVFYISLSFAIICNWYIGYMLCIFSFLYLIYLIAPDFKNNCKKILKFISVGVLCAGTAGIVLIPAVYSQMQTFSRIESVQSSLWNINFKVFDIFSKLIIGSFDVWQITSTGTSSEYLNLPNIYCGILVVFMCVIYFINPKTKRQDKLKDGIFIEVLVCCCLFNFLNIVWHVFSDNIWYPNRYSFVISFFLILIAYKAYSNLDKSDNKQIMNSGFIIIGICFLIEKFEYTYLTTAVIYLSILILIMYMIIFIRLKDKKYFLFTLLLVICLESFVNSVIICKNFSYCDRNKFYAEFAEVNEAVEKIKESDDTHCRIENNIASAYSFSFGNGIPSISGSSSAMNVKGYEFLEEIGFKCDSHIHVIYNFTTPFNDTILGIKYFIGNDAENNYKKISFADNVWINEDALSLGFMVNEGILGVENFLSDDDEVINPFEKQNLLGRKMTGIDKNVFEKIDVNISYENLKKGEEEENIRQKEYGYDKSYCNFNFVASKSGFVYTYLDDVNSNTGWRIYVNDENILEPEELAEVSTINLGYFNGGEQVKVRYEIPYNSSINIEYIQVYRFNQDVYDEVMAELDKNQLHISEMTDARISGEISAGSGKELLFLSVPYDRFLRISVDGIETETFEVLDSLIGVRLTPGEHDIKIWYDPVQLKTGVGISVIFVMLAVIIIPKLTKRS